MPNMRVRGRQVGRHFLGFVIVCVAVPFQLLTVAFGYIYIALDSLAAKMGGE